MSVEENKNLVRRYFAALDRQRLDEVGALFAPEYRLRFDGNPELNREGALGLFGMFFGAFPDVRHELLDLVGEGDRVAARLTVRGTHRGDLMGIPPTGTSVAFGAMNFFRLADGAIAEHWAATDMLGPLRQLGAVPA